jgi:hypothetical protein
MEELQSRAVRTSLLAKAIGDANDPVEAPTPELLSRIGPSIHPLVA